MQILGILLGLLGAALIYAGVFSSLNELDLYFTILGSLLSLSGLLLLLKHKSGVYCYALALALVYLVAGLAYCDGALFSEALKKVALLSLIGIYVFSGKVYGQLKTAR